jgi:hypothetical protein
MQKAGHDIQHELLDCFVGYPLVPEEGQLHTLVSSWLFSGYASSMPILLLSFFTNYISFSSFCYAYCSSFSLVSP